MITRDIVQAVAGGIQLLVPSQVRIRVEGDYIVVETPEGIDYLPLATNIDLRLADGLSSNEAIIDAASSMMSELQDVVSIYLHQPWPAGSHGQKEFLAPHADIRDGALWLWFGDSIDLADTRSACVRVLLGDEPHL